VEFDGVQARAVARGVARAVAESGYDVYAFSIMQSHAHAVVGRHDNPAERIISHFKGRATQQLVAEGIHPMSRFEKSSGEIPCCWARRGWKVFLDSSADIERAIEYVRDNPVMEGKKLQNWTFLTEFSG
jgi:REP element-mobilizing transposase RayT